MDSQQFEHVASGTIELGRHSMPVRLRLIYEEVTELIQEHSISRFAIESVFVSVNPQSALKLGQARGAAITAAAMCDLAVNEYSPRAVKTAVTGTGGATKEQVQFMTRTLLNLPEIPKEDAADALAVAICEARASAFQHVLQTQATSRS